MAALYVTSSRTRIETNHCLAGSHCRRGIGTRAEMGQMDGGVEAFQNVPLLISKSARVDQRGAKDVIEGNILSGGLTGLALRLRMSTCRQ